MNIIVDSREVHLIPLLNDSKIKQLDLGDIHFVDENDNIKCIIERKTVSDLSSSIKDSRSREQRSRLLSFRNETNCRIIYLIEGTFFSNNLLSLKK